MALIKFNRSATKATATGSSRDADTLYFPTDEQAVYLNGKRVGGDAVSSAETAGYSTEAGQVTKSITITKGSSSTVYNGSTDATITIPTTPSEVGAAPSSHNHDSVYSKLGHTHPNLKVRIYGESDKIYNGGEEVTLDFGDSVTKNYTTSLTAGTEGMLPTVQVMKDYVDGQIKNYTSAFRFAGRLNWIDNDWYINDIPTDIVTVINQRMSLSEFVGGAADEGYMKVGHSFYVGVVSANPVDNTFSGEIVQEGDMVTCVNLYNAEGTYEPQYHVINSNITVTDSINASSPAMIPTSKAVQDAISTAVGELDSSTSASSGNVLTGITITDGKISGKTETPMYTHPTYEPNAGYPVDDPSPGFGESFTIVQVGNDEQGHVNRHNGRVVTIPDTEATTSVKGLMTTTQVTNLEAVLDALTWK